MYGIVGLLALEGLQFIPVAHIIWSPLARSETDGPDLRRALAAVILMSALDNLLNGSMILPILLLIGGLSKTNSSIFDGQNEASPAHARSKVIPYMQVSAGTLDSQFSERASVASSSGMRPRDQPNTYR